MKTELLVAWSCLLLTATARAQDASPSKPSLLDSTYVATTFLGTETIHLYEESGKLKWDGKLTLKEKYRTKGRKESEFSESVQYDKVNFVQYVPKSGPEQPSVHIGDSLGFNRTVALPADTDEGQGLAEYVARKSPLGLELIGRAWRVRKPFACPEKGQLGCRDFKDLLDHGDADIAEYFYSGDENSHTYACFRNEEESFFILQYSHLTDFGTFTFEEFQNQQSARSEFGSLRWRNDTGFITEPELVVRRGARPQSLGSMDQSSLSYQSKYPNREDTTTQYSLSVRWSTGRFTENFSGKDKKGETWNFDKTGVCAKLN
jgi:hypothetical protein